MLKIKSKVDFGCLHHRIQTNEPELASCLYERALNEGHEPEFTAADRFFLIEFYASKAACKALVAAVRGAS